ncbi:DUF1800 domain-containing protein [Paracoccus denitrificans]|jgi:uncharacterized protein (DUF1800 family)|uniref:DUF1800 domain-containing protein n=1 Tax=Paracoccus denitrificans (strain Pd 1222) TaxID=318586 RepID=A1B430_PARDP|nr:DUF1800 domain-containing protein [Paracoccus denitrificans]ABL70274.1 conserved hypothetical protein [Paracoccus denitrificans PD1222]MBB4627182.1 uncharacterized protein (DUF1800 family) [Paracoccus denitrificans]MCU7428045.1 DUF1800 domain-containing protein [Paracoccus denitrificans]QAR25624.1 DUF1800 domain-containing protein [Paracoccus denitrificans]UPV94522.1 DUF1800 domain-containing protein [Paracoccus denitrificans]
MSFGFPELAAIRLGFGLSPLMPPPADVEAVLAGAANAGPGPEAVTTDTAREIATRFRLGLQALREDRPEPPEAQEAGRLLGTLPLEDLRRRVIRALDDPIGFGERLVQFWSDHFTVRAINKVNNALAMAFVDEAIRPHVNGRFEDMFLAADTHPMMLVYLDQTSSRGPNSPFARRRPQRHLGLNENLAREALELHSLGVGAGYDQKDVRELAELLTGLSFSHQEGFAFKRAWAEPGAETVLGQAYGGGRRGGLDDIRAAFRDIARRPETARHLSRKLAVHFVSDDPSEDLVGSMAAIWRDSGGDLPQVYRVMASHPDLASGLRQKVRQPFDFCVAGLRALGIRGERIARLELPEFRRAAWGPVEAMGQPWGRPKGPDGWPEGADAWIAPQTLAARINWSLRIPRLLLDELPDPRGMLVSAFGSTQSAELAWAVPKAESAAEGVALILASGDFNRR